jgi:hypothetical protein
MWRHVHHDQRDVVQPTRIHGQSEERFSRHFGCGGNGHHLLNIAAANHVGEAIAAD